MAFSQSHNCDTQDRFTDGLPHFPGQIRQPGLSHRCWAKGVSERYASAVPGVSRRRAHYPKPLYPARPSLRFRSCRSAVRKTGLPLLAGMAVTFALVASLATVGGGWAVRANQFGRAAALILFGVFGLTLLFSSLAERISRPLVRLGNKLQNPDAGPGITNSFLLGIGTGLL